MNFLKNIWNKIKHPKGLPLFLFFLWFVAITTTTILLVIFIHDQTVIHFILYALAAITLAYAIYTLIYLTPKMKDGMIKLLYKNKFTKSLLDDYGYRTTIFSAFSLLINITYVAFLGVTGIMSGSAWYISLTVYYLVLSLMKGSLFYSKHKHNTPLKKARAYRFSGIMLLFMTIAFSGIVVLVYTSNMSFEYAGLMIYVVATFTFYKLGIALYNIFKARKQNNLYIQTIRNINLASALISIVVLQVAMFQSFSPELNKSIANGLTGGLISIIIMILGIFMISKANKQITKIKQAEVTNDTTIK